MHRTITNPVDGQQGEISSTRDGVAQYKLKSASGDYQTTWSSFALSYDLVLADFRTSNSIKFGTAAPLVFGSSMSGTVGYAYTGWNRYAYTGSIAMTSTELSLTVSPGTGASFSPKYRNAAMVWTAAPRTATRSGHLDLVIGDGALAGKTVSYENLVPAVFDLSVADLSAQAGQSKVQVFFQPIAGWTSSPSASRWCLPGIHRPRSRSSTIWMEMAVSMRGVTSRRQRSRPHSSAAGALPGRPSVR